MICVPEGDFPLTSAIVMRHSGSGLYWLWPAYSAEHECARHRDSWREVRARGDLTITCAEGYETVRAAAVSAADCTNLSLANLRVINNWHQGSAIVVTGPIESRGVRVRDNHIENAAQGIDLHADHVIVSGNLVVNSFIGMKAMHGSRHVLIANNQFIRNDLWAIGLMPGTGSHAVDRRDQRRGPAHTANLDGGHVVANNIISELRSRRLVVDLERRRFHLGRSCSTAAKSRTIRLCETWSSPATSSRIRLQTRTRRTPCRVRLSRCATATPSGLIPGRRDPRRCTFMATSSRRDAMESPTWNSVHKTTPMPSIDLHPLIAVLFFAPAGSDYGTNNQGRVSL